MKRLIVICLVVPLLYVVLSLELSLQPETTRASRIYAQNVAKLEKTTTPMSYSSHSFQSGGVQEAWVRHYSSGLATTFDQATAMTLDRAGNVYVTGRSSNFTSGADYLTIKYDAAGKQIWTIRYNGEGNGDDFVSATAVDAMGNVYVTGKSEGDGTSFDYVTIKYSNAGVQEWIARYNGPGNANDEAVALAVDSSGNIYVTGSSVGASYDYATIKYATTGLQEWVVRYNGPENLDERAVDLAIADSGNICVTGSGRRSMVGPYDYVTIKYDMNGKEKWLARYTGPSDFDGNESAVDLAVDKAGNVYVTGNSGGPDFFSDYATVKYNRAGKQEWVARYTAAGDEVAAAMTVDDSENVYVTGYSWRIASGLLSDYRTVKYNSAGVQQWVACYCAISSPDEPTAIAVDKSGDVYVTGKSAAFGTSSDYLTIKYNSRGEQQWLARYNSQGNGSDFASALVLDARGNVYVTGTSGTGDDADYLTVKYNDNGIQQWTSIYSGENNSRDEATAMVAHDTGNVYVTGWSFASGSSRDYATIKYTPSGEQEWVARYNGPENSIDQAAAMAIDRKGNVYVTGRSVGSNSSYDYVTIKYNNAGVEQWIARYNGTKNVADNATAIAVDVAGNVYVTGSSSELGSSSAYTTIKYNSAGMQQWIAHYYYGVGIAMAITVDALSNVYVLSSFEYMVKYDSAGVEQWVNRLERWEAAALAVGDSGYIYVTGSTQTGPGITYYNTQKYSGAGVRQWEAHYSVSQNSQNESTALLLDHAGNVYVTGSGYPDYATIKYNYTGIQQWVARYHRPENSYNFPTALTLDNLGNVYVTGSSGFYAGITDYATVKYDSNGVEQWVARFSGPRNSSDSPNAISVDKAGNVYVAGTSRSDLGWSIYTTIKYVQNPVAVVEQRTNGLIKYYLSQNYPNPFNPATKIRYAIPQPAHVSLKILDLLGHEVAVLLNETKVAGEYEVQWNPIGLPSGIYIYRLQAGDFVETKKLILLQ